MGACLTVKHTIEMAVLLRMLPPPPRTSLIATEGYGSSLALGTPPTRDMLLSPTSLEKIYLAVKAVFQTDYPIEFNPQRASLQDLRKFVADVVGVVTQCPDRDQRHDQSAERCANESNCCCRNLHTNLELDPASSC